ncbi:hypothetical protein CDQ92_13355 [Sphingopyxis bauzanensis]|uniref:Uncharacterized protein n=1 Tax=Sphingopyxis bauzanensis TaxID=651663 RepID=A0A246JS50_9SPHN|nr:hypothetical protein [Sphingopyxis bauzanensis]OWQ95763.1 hypothetical protein CDQ92_13355 [Sphingopyxis bauzanensis]GGJ39822.1 hypothetical protein GCM10011393_07600 [Sphingopyxis bauzanensis]
MSIPNSTPDIAYSMAVDDLYSEAANFVDGEPVKTQGEADALAAIITGAKQIRKDADAARKTEKQPHDDAAKAVQAKWAPVLTKVDDVITAVQKPLTAWLLAQEEERQRIAQETQAEADRLAEQAIAAARTSGSLESLTATRELQDAAFDAAKVAKRAGKAKSHVHGGGRAFGLRTYWEASLTDSGEALKWAKARHPEELREFLRELAGKAVNAGAREIPGFTINQERKVA